MPKLKDIPQYVNHRSCYHVDVAWPYMQQKWIPAQIEEEGLQLIPEFQRGHVWTEQQQIAFVEFKLSGGQSGDAILFNYPYMRKGEIGPDVYKDYVLVDGLQRLTAVDRFLKNEIPAFGKNLNQWEDGAVYVRHEMRWSVYVHELQTEADVLQWYLQLNAGGTPHSKEEITRVTALLEKAKQHV